MITPAKHLDLDLSVLRAGAIMLNTLRKARRIELPKMREKLVSTMGADAELIFMPALNFLFLLGRLEYHSKNDSLEYLQSPPPSPCNQEKGTK